MVALPILAGIGTARPSIHCRFLSAPSSASMQSRPEPVRSAASCSVQLPARWFCSSDARRSHARVGRSCAWRSHWSSRPQPRSQVIRRRPRSSAWPRHPKDGVRSLRSPGQWQLVSLLGKDFPQRHRLPATIISIAQHSRGGRAYGATHWSRATDLARRVRASTAWMWIMTEGHGCPLRDRPWRKNLTFLQGLW